MTDLAPRRLRVLVAVARLCDGDAEQVCRLTLSSLAARLGLHEKTLSAEMVALAEDGLIEPSLVRVRTQPLGGFVAKRMTPEGWLAAARAPRVLRQQVQECVP